MKTNRLFVAISCFVTLSVILIGFRMGAYYKDKIYEQQILYKWQNLAFHLCYYDESTVFHGIEESNKYYIKLGIYVYNNDQSKYSLSEEDVYDYFRNEYDDEGELSIYNRSEQIQGYIDWWIYDDGEEKINTYKDELNNYMRKKGINKNVSEINLDELDKVICNYEAENM